jgi:Tfp pilus assembly protein PilX
MIKSRWIRPSKGYSLTVVLIFLIMLFALWSAVYRSTSGLLRIETNRVMQQSRDEGAMTALAQALQLLQYATPRDSTNPSRTHFIYGVSVTTLSTSGSCATSSYTVQFTAMPQQGPYRWQVQVNPGSYVVPLPTPGAIPQWP